MRGGSTASWRARSPGRCGGIDSPRVLDLGCGTGALAEIVLDEMPGCALVGVDLSANMAERAAERLGGRAEVVVGDAERLPFRDNSFDAAYCNDSFHHYPDPALAAFQVWRALRPGGTFVVGDVWQPAPARAVMNAWMPHSAEGRRAHLLRGRDAGDPRRGGSCSVSWRRIGLTSCVAIARKD